MDLNAGYHYLTQHIVPGPQNLSYFIPLICLPVALLIPRSRLSRWQSIGLFLPIIAVASVLAWIAIDGVDVISVDVVLWSLYLLLLKDPWTEFSYLSTSASNEAFQKIEPLPGPRSTASVDVDEDAVNESTPLTADPNQFDKTTIGQKYPSSLPQRLSWIGMLLVSIRLNNWVINLPSHDRRQPPPPAFKSRKSFALYTIFSFTRGYLILDLTSAYVSIDPYFTDTSIPVWSALPLKQLSFVPAQFFRSMIIGAQAWALIGQMFYLPCLLPVGLNALGLLPSDWSPHNWAGYFGSSQTIFLHGVRGFWGQYWHQMMRHSTSGPGYALADILKLKSGSMLRYALITIVAFGLSGIVHMGLVPPEPLHATIGVNAVRMCFAGFFWMQSIGILAEVSFIRLFSLFAGRSWITRSQSRFFQILLNVVWVLTWFSFCIPILGEGARQLGYWRIWIVPVSIWKALHGENCLAWSVLR